MNKLKTILFFILMWSFSVSAQITVTHFNAGWNDANKVDWVKKLKECDITYVDIAKEAKLQKKHKVVVVPTIIIFKDGEEVERFQADISFKMTATREEVQEIIDELIMSDF
tara:strand:+ start:1151 stop:1483 length:333 start_codon:yes stop_codon:yes gene_type:complete